MTRMAGGQKTVISWQDAPDDLFFRATAAAKKVRLVTECFSQFLTLHFSRGSNYQSEPSGDALADLSGKSSNSEHLQNNRHDEIWKYVILLYRPLYTLLLYYQYWLYECQPVLM